MKLTIVKPSSPAEKQTSSTLDTVEVTPGLAKAWRPPPFQRPMVLNAKCQDVMAEIRRTGVIPGIVTLGVLRSEPSVLYVVDGQHRVGAYLASEMPIAYADIRTVFCESMAEMAEEFVKLNSALRRMTPDDVLRGLEASYEALRIVRERCRFVGYDMIRRSDKAPILSMSMVLRNWRGSSCEVPSPAGNGGAASLAATLTTDEAAQLSAFLNLCLKAWGRDREYVKLWGSLNLILCAWLYRRTVLSRYSAKTPALSSDLFCKCLMSVSADKHYVDWLVGRNIGDRDRSPAYQRLKTIIANRLMQEMGKRPSMPAPAWTNG
jgi:hypothetical protein